MAKKRVAIENTLGSVKQLLDQNGYEVVQLDPHTQTGIELKNCDAVVISGMDDNMMGMTTIKTGSPVISAKGMSPQEVLNQLENTMKQV
ncbi:YkuS family protein [Phosphitispora fastidiosa]|uniref:YkuS family protein n=1 Tax=Phosphitispora fastidiosa TaxID=2837202 RepID=UPI001E4570AA|nr:YkuS family protein [Phosphitispora fastidiosa]MBU7006475.1 galactitol-specific phosphotransferase system IIB component [Phosphitispora fastidiosa]